MSFTDDLLHNEKEELVEYFLTMADNPLELTSEYMQKLFNKYNVHEDSEVREILQACYEDAFFNYSIPFNEDDCAWLNIGEIETETENIPEEELEDYTIVGQFAYYYIGYGLSIKFSLLKMQQLLDEHNYNRAVDRSLYTCIYYHDVWYYDGGFQVNDIAVLEKDIYIDFSEITDRALFNLFADIVGINKRLRAIEVDYLDESMIELSYTAGGDRYPLGRFELQID